MQVIDNIIVFGETDAATLAQMRRVRDTGPVAGAALMADNHHKTASGFLNLAAGRRFAERAPGESMDQAPTLLDLRSDLGQF